MKKLFYLLVAITLCWSTNAQVRIGGDADPHASAVLDLNPNTGSSTLGLALPRVALTATTDVTTIKTPATGLTVYNTATAGTGVNQVKPGVYSYDGSKWIAIGAITTAPTIVTQPKAFTFSRAYDQYGDPQAAKSYITTLTVTATGATSYQWYKKAKNQNAADEKIAGATANSYSPKFTIASVSDWGLSKYYCVVSNQYGSVKTELAEIALGCGAKNEAGGWIKFMCHNLGADQSLDPFGADTIYTPSSPSYSMTSNAFTAEQQSAFAKDILRYGDFYQWGRYTDGHEKWGSNTIAGPWGTGTGVDSGTSNLQIPANSASYGKFVLNALMVTAYDWRTPQYDMSWRAHKDANRDPCPPNTAGQGWHVPTTDQWGSIYQTGSTYGFSTDATVNTWRWTGRGYAILPDGETITLFLPAAGSRNYSNGGIYSLGTSGGYWSSSVSGSNALFLYINSARVFPAASNHRSFGSSIRCVSE